MSRSHFSSWTAGLLLGVLGVANSFAGQNMIGRQSQNEGLLAVPKMGDVAIDGKLDEWDWSGRIWSFADTSVRNSYSTETAAMWDKDYVYIAIKWKDTTPMHSEVDPRFNPEQGWKSDAAQIRIATSDQVSWLTTWYFTPRKQPVLIQDIWKNPEDSRKGVVSHTYTNDTGASDLGDGFAMAYRINEAGDGFTQEIRIPWAKLFAAPPEVKAGLTLHMGFEFLWGDITGKTWPIHRYADNLQPGKTSREFFWTATKDWGDLKLGDRNNVEVKQYVDESNKLTGRIQLRLELPADAVRFSVAIDDNRGQRVRNMGGLDVADYTVSVNGKTRIVEVPWDGLSDPQFDNAKKAPPQLMPAGSYRAKALYHSGLHAHYEMCFYNPGTPPWNVVGGSGGWGADHIAPLRVARSGDGMIVSWAFAEGGAGILGLDSTGQKRWEEKRGGQYLAADEQYVYAVPEGWHIKEDLLIRLDRKTGKYAPFTADGKELPFELPLTTVFGEKVPGKVVGLAVGGDTLAVSMSDGLVGLLDRTSGKLQKQIKVAGVTRLAFGPDGKLFALAGGTAADERADAVGGRLFRIDTAAGTATAVELLDVAKAADITIDRDGNLLVADLGPDCQVKAFSPDGKLQYTCGQKGGRPIRGKFEPQAMSHMSSVSTDQSGNVWVVESWNFPRRVSVWGRDGKLVRDYIGNTGYAGTGTYLHDTDPTLGYCGPLEFKLDKEHRTWSLQNILWVPDETKGERLPISPQEHVGMRRFASSASGKSHDYLFSPPFRPWEGFIVYLDRNGDWKPASAVVLLAQLSGGLDVKGIVTAMPDGEFAGLDAYDIAFWTDANRDGIAQRSECKILPATKASGGIGKKGTAAISLYAGWGAGIRDDFSFYSNGIVEFRPNGFTEDGAPIYTPESVRPIGVADQGDLKPLPESSALLCLSPKGLRGIDSKDGKVLWTYPNPYNSVHGSHRATMPKPGLLIGPLKITGLAKVNDEVGNVMHIRGNLGQDFLLTTDGLYVDALFNDTRLPDQPLPPTEAELVKMPLENFSQGGEPFNGWFGKQSDGVIRLTSGLPRQACMIMNVTGLETIHRLPEQTVVIDTGLASQLATDQDARLAAAAKDQVHDYTIARMAKAPTIDARIEDWKAIDDIQATRDGSAEQSSVKLAYDDTNLYALYDVKDASPWKNEGRDYLRLFKTGDTVDLQLSTTANRGNAPKAGDVRILAASLGGKPKAIVMRPIAPGAPVADHHTYVSPVQPRAFDQVAIADDVKVFAKPAGDGRYIVEMAIPWSVIGIQPKAGLAMTGDVGITGSNTEGNLTVSRTYWSNQKTNLVNDEPAESWLTPNEWGAMKLGE